MSSVTLGINISSLKAQGNLWKSTSEVNSAYERLSSGLRINKGSDDPAGLSVGIGLENDRRVFTQGVRNLNDGISLLNLADGALEDLTAIVTRLKELSVQASNGSYSSTQRRALDLEAQALSKEYLRIAQSTKFNGKGIFHPSFGSLSLQGGYGTSGAITSNLGGAIGTGSFTSTATYGISGVNVTQVQLSDINGDGNVDMVAAAGDILVRLGTGNGAFGAVTTYVVNGTNAIAVALGDLNGDGFIDIVSGEGSTGGVSIYLGSGSGTFTKTGSYSMNTTLNDVALGDFNGDGALDIVTVGINASGTGQIRLGNGNGTFGAASSFAMETLPSGIAVGDLNGDSILDLVSSGATGVGYTTVRLGTGNGTFGASRSYQTGGATASELALKDLNDDGRLDLVTIGFDAAVFLNQGDGTFGARTNYAMNGTTGTSIALGDLNGDGIVDIASVDDTTKVNVRLGLGGGVFGGYTAYTLSGTGGTGLGMSDINNDGVLDLAAGSFSGGSIVTVFLGATTYGIGALLEFSLKTKEDASQASSRFSQKLNQLTTQRGQIGAFSSRVNVASNVYQSLADTYREAESRIKDADIASETSRLVALQILQQAGTAVLGQANLQSQLVLKLLEN